MVRTRGFERSNGGGGGVERSIDGHRRSACHSTANLLHKRRVGHKGDNCSTWEVVRVRKVGVQVGGQTPTGLYRRMF